MSDVVQNVIIRIGAQDAYASVFARVAPTIRNSLAGVETALQSVAARATASAIESASAFTKGRGDFAAAAKIVVDKARGELAKLAANKDVQLGIEIGTEKLDEARIKIGQFLAQTTKGARFKWQVAVEFKDEVVDEARRALTAKFAPVQRAIRVPIAIAKEKLSTALVEADAIIDRWRREHASIRVAFAVAKSAGAVLSSATAVLAPLRAMAAAGINVVINGSVAGLANAARYALGAVASVAKGALSAAGAVASAFGVIGAGVALAIGGVGGAIIAFKAYVMSAIDSTGDLADRLGATTEGLMALEHAARTNGSSADVMDASLQRMSRTIGDALRGSDEASAKFNGLGLSVSKLATMNADEAFGAIAAKIAALPTPAQRASAAIAVFGKEAGSLQTLLSKGAAGIADARAEAERMGLVLSRVDIAKVHAANDAMEALSNQLKGYLTQAAVAIAPYIQAVAEKLLSLMPTGQQVATYLVQAMATVGGAIAYVADVVNLFIAGWYGLNAAVIAVAAGVVKSIDLMGSGIVALMNLLPGVEVEWTDTFATMADSMAEDVIAAADKAADAYGKFDRGDASKAVNKFFADATVAAQANADKIAKNADAYRQAGLAASQLGDDAGASAEKAKKLADEMVRMSSDRISIGLTDAQKEVAKLVAMGAKPMGLEVQLAIDTGALKETIDRVLKSVADDKSDPWVAWERGLDVLDKLRAAGKLTAQQFDSIRAQLNKSLESQQDDMVKRIREVAGGPAEEAIQKIREAQNLVDLGKLDRATFNAYAKDLYAKAGSGTEKGEATVTFASGKDQGLNTGFNDASRERLAMLTPVKSIAADTKAIRDYLRTLATNSTRDTARQGVAGGIATVFDVAR